MNLLPVSVVPDFTGLTVGLCEDGGLYRLRLFGTQTLIVGATNAGKGGRTGPWRAGRPRIRRV